ncbi:MAG: nucleotidyltransferase domain-containing protein [Candidatus Gastranaerophilales bacterium]|nr:nucleotidyltransferase domain-containing protein [Candidatus Gastranaerophilales bacterium]
MKNKIKKVINILNERLKETFTDFKGAYLYGSYAKNTSHKYSDIDMVALFETEPNMEKRFQIWSIIGPLEAKYDVFFDLNPTSIENLSKNPFYYDEVVNKGIFYNAA